tara:strand:+ start:323 stop:1060 length:738 start_codon:yes stop_codon:yes gene_type:complete
MPKTRAQILAERKKTGKNSPSETWIAKKKAKPRGPQRKIKDVLPIRKKSTVTSAKKQMKDAVAQRKPGKKKTNFQKQQEEKAAMRKSGKSKFTRTKEAAAKGGSGRKPASTTSKKKINLEKLRKSDERRIKMQKIRKKQKLDPYVKTKKKPASTTSKKKINLEKLRKSDERRIKMQKIRKKQKLDPYVKTKKKPASTTSKKKKKVVISNKTKRFVNKVAKKVGGGASYKKKYDKDAKGYKFPFVD